jgi:hypothetical protein
MLGTQGQALTVASRRKVPKLCRAGLTVTSHHMHVSTAALQGYCHHFQHLVCDSHFPKSCAFTPPQNPNIQVLTLEVKVLGGGRLWEVIRSSRMGLVSPEKREDTVRGHVIVPPASQDGSPQQVQSVSILDSPAPASAFPGRNTFLLPRSRYFATAPTVDLSP